MKNSLDSCLSIRDIREIRGPMQLVTCFAMKLHIESMAAESDTVAVRYTERGSFVSAFRDQGPTGKTYEVVAME